MPIRLFETSRRRASERPSELSWRHALADASGTEVGERGMPVPEPTHPALKLAVRGGGRSTTGQSSKAVSQRIDAQIDAQIVARIADFRGRWLTPILCCAGLALAIGAGAALQQSKSRHESSSAITAVTSVPDASERAAAQLEAFVSANRQKDTPPVSIPATATLPPMPSAAAAMNAPQKSSPVVSRAVTPTVTPAVSPAPPTAVTIRSAMGSPRAAATGFAAIEPTKPMLPNALTLPPFRVDRIVEVEGVLRADVRALDAASTGERYGAGAMLADGWELAGVESDHVVVIGRDNIQHRLSTPATEGATP